MLSAWSLGTRDCDRALLLVGLVSRVRTHIVDTTIQMYTRRPIFQKGLASARGHTATGRWSRAGILGGKQDQVLASSRLALGLETKQEQRTQGSRD